MTPTSGDPDRSSSTRSSPPSEGGWFWIDHRVLDEFDLSATELAVYAAICRRVTRGTGRASKADLADLAGCSVRSVPPAIDSLEDAGLVERVPRADPETGMQLPNGFRVADLSTGGMQLFHPPHASDAHVEDNRVEEYPPPTRATPEIVDNFRAHFRWLERVDDADKMGAVCRLAARVDSALEDALTKAAPGKVAAAAVQATYPDEVADAGEDQLLHVLDTLASLEDWSRVVAAVAVASVLGLPFVRISAVLDGWCSADRGGAGPAGDRPETLDEAREWAEANDLPPRVGVGLWKLVGCRGWTMTGTIGPQGETIEDLEAWAHAHQNELLQAARNGNHPT